MEICKDITLDNNLTMFPFIEVDKEYYQSLVIDIKSIPEDIHSVDDSTMLALRFAGQQKNWGMCMVFGNVRA